MTAEHPSFVHTAGLYGSDEELIRLLCRFLLDGAAVGDRLFLRGYEELHERLAALLPEGSQITVLGVPEAATNPAAAIRAQLHTIHSDRSAGSGRVRIAGPVLPRSPAGRAWEPWARYEAVLNDLFADLPLTGLCLYDTRVTPPAVLDDVWRAHPLVVTADGPVPSERYAGSAAFRTGRALPPSVPVQTRPPALELAGPTPRRARHAVAGLADSAGLPADKVDSLVLAVSEVVANADLHGRPPVTVSGWAGDGLVVVSVHDGGTGPGDVEAGLVPRSAGGAGLGLGLWIAHLVCDEVVQHADDSGFTVRLTAQVA